MKANAEVNYNKNNKISRLIRYAEFENTLLPFRYRSMILEPNIFYFFLAVKAKVSYDNNIAIK